MINSISNQSANNFQYNNNYYQPHTAYQPPFNLGNNLSYINQNRDAMSAVLSLLQQVISLLGGASQNNIPNPTEIQFDEGYPKAITHSANGEPLRSIEYSGDGFNAIQENGIGFGMQVAFGGEYSRPKINGQFVMRADYATNTATYTLEDGTALTGVKPYITEQQANLSGNIVGNPGMALTNGQGAVQGQIVGEKIERGADNGQGYYLPPTVNPKVASF